MATPPPLKQKFPRNPSSLAFWGFTLGSHPGRVQRANHCNKTHVGHGHLSRYWDNLRKASRVMQTPPAVCGKIPICNFIPRDADSGSHISVGWNFGWGKFWEKKTCWEFGGVSKSSCTQWLLVWCPKITTLKNIITQQILVQIQKGMFKRSIFRIQNVILIRI